MLFDTNQLEYESSKFAQVHSTKKTVDCCGCGCFNQLGLNSFKKIKYD